MESQFTEAWIRGSDCRHDKDAFMPHSGGDQHTKNSVDSAVRHALTMWQLKSHRFLTDIFAQRHGYTTLRDQRNSRGKNTIFNST